jgi:hypothetical protein
MAIRRSGSGEKMRELSGIARYGDQLQATMKRREERFLDIGERESIIRRIKGYFWNYKNTSKKYSDVLPNLIGSV